MKKWISLCLLAVWLLTVPAMADVIWEPDDDFYSSHRDQCDYLGRSYYVNGPQGGTALWRKEPGGGHVRVLENGTRLYISYA